MLLRLNKYGEAETKFEVNHKHIRVKNGSYFYYGFFFVFFFFLLLLCDSHGQTHEYMKKTSFVENKDYNFDF